MHHQAVQTFTLHLIKFHRKKGLRLLCPNLIRLVIDGEVWRARLEQTDPSWKQTVVSVKSHCYYVIKGAFGHSPFLVPSMLDPILLFDWLSMKKAQSF